MIRRGVGAGYGGDLRRPELPHVPHILPLASVDIAYPYVSPSNGGGVVGEPGSGTLVITATISSSGSLLNRVPL